MDGKSGALTCWEWETAPDHDFIAAKVIAQAGQLKQRIGSLTLWNIGGRKGALRRLL